MRIKVTCQPPFLLGSSDQVCTIHSPLELHPIAHHASLSGRIKSSIVKFIQLYMVCTRVMLMLASCRFTDYLDLEHRAHGIRSFALHPGGVRTGKPNKGPKLLTTWPQILCSKLPIHGWLASEQLISSFLCQNACGACKYTLVECPIIHSQPDSIELAMLQKEPGSWVSAVS